MSLLDDLRQAEAESKGDLPCPLCEYIEGTADDTTRSALRAAAAGTMGLRKLEAIMQKYETGIGRRTIARHRTERHGQ